jgi:regulator of sigma E protease
MDFLIANLQKLAAFVFVLGVTIFVHEFGHFITAKLFGMRVFVFSFGFGQRLLGYKWGDTDLRLSLIPLGGYVKLEGEPDDKLSEDTSTIGDGKDFTARPRWQRIIVYLAGPFMNVVLTAAVLTGIYIYGTGVMSAPYEPPIIGSVEEGSPAAQAGLQTGDQIVSIDGVPQHIWEDVLITIALRPDTDVRLRVRRGTEEREVPIRIRKGEREAGEIGVAWIVRVGVVTAGSPAEQAGLRPDDGLIRMAGQRIQYFDDVVKVVKANDGKPIPIEVYREGSLLNLTVTPQDGKIGLGVKLIPKKFGFRQAVVEGTRQTLRIAAQTVTMLRDLIAARISPKVAFSGPAGIYEAAGEAAAHSFMSVVQLIALISISVGILNLFPLPPLDGGHLAILFVESIIRRDLSLNAKTWIINAGAIVLLLVIAAVLYLDFSKMAWFKNLFGN